MLHEEHVLRAPSQMFDRPEAGLFISAHGARIRRVRIYDDRLVAFGAQHGDKRDERRRPDAARQVFRRAD
jgi:hypothetical protein